MFDFVCESQTAMFASKKCTVASPSSVSGGISYSSSHNKREKVSAIQKGEWN
jgi:hypothetical protein